MGNCCNKNSTQIVKSPELIDQNSSNNKVVPFQNIQINVFISYCWFDKSLSHSLAKELSKKGFNIFIDRDKVTLDSFTSLEKSDFAIICLSNSYLKCFNCQREARLVFDQKIPVIAVSLSNDYTPNKWLSQIIAGTEYKKLSEISKVYEYPNLKKLIHEKIQILYSKLVLDKELKKYHKFQNISEIEKRKLDYDKKFSLQVQNEKIIVDEECEHLKKVFVYDDFLKGLYLDVPWIYRWYNKYPAVTWSNFPPFSPSGDVNDAVFEMPPEYFESLKSSYGFPWNCKYDSHLRSKKSTNLCLVSADYEKNLMNKKKNESKYNDASILDFMKSIERLWSLDTSIPKGYVVWYTIENLNFNRLPPRTEKEIMRRKLLDSDLRIKKSLRIKISKYFIDKYHDCEQNQFCLFAEKMLKNIQEFENFCKKN